MPTSPRARRAPDPRLLIGVGLVVASVAGVVGLVAAVDRREPVYAAAAPLQPGDRLEPDALVERRVALDGAESLYLRAGELPDDGLVVTRPIREGELITTSALGAASAVDATAVVVELAAPVSASVGPGSAVDVWTARAAETTGAGAAPPAPPRVLVSDAVVVEVRDDGGLVATGGGASVEVLVPRGRVARLLQAIADEARLSVVPAGVGEAAP